MARSLAQQLDDLDAAIEAIEKGAQSFSRGDRMYTRGQLSAYYAERIRLEAKVTSSDKGGRTVAEF